MSGQRLSGLLLLPLAAFGAAPPPAPETPDPDELSIEQLLDTEVYTVSKFLQKKTEAPAAATIISAQDVKDFGIRFLSDILRTIPGVYINYDRNYTAIGVRGFTRPGDFNSRILLLVDGYRINEPIFDQASVGTDFPIDVENIERLEFVPGPGSAVYGNNAFIGVLNIITKSGKGIGGLEASGYAASFGTDRERIAYGERFENGLDVAVSASRFDSAGQDHYFRDFDAPETNNGVARNLDFDHAEHAFGKIGYEGLVIEAGFVSRTKGIPTASFNTAFNEGPNQTTDNQFFGDIKYNASLRDDLFFDVHAYHGRYDFTGANILAVDPRRINNDEAHGHWWGTEARLTTTYFEQHRLIVGAEYQDNFTQDQVNFLTNPFVVNLESQANSYRYGVYTQDDFQVTDDFTLNAGVRYDQYNLFGGTVNPRVALIYKPITDTVLKFLYSTAFRAPNVYELYYSDPNNIKPSLRLGPERIRTYEAIVEYSPLPRWKTTLDGFHYEISDLIDLTTDPADDLLVYSNTGQANAWGTELQSDYIWSNGTRFRAAYTWVHATNPETGKVLVNSPSSLVKANFNIPVWDDRFRVGVNGQYTSMREGLNGTAAGYFVIDLTVSTSERLSREVLKGFELSASVYNLLDQKYAAIAGPEHVMNLIYQDGISFRVLAGFKY
jgi:iron complex outermembrane receptor protein